jgi:hypothetical protein
MRSLNMDLKRSAGRIRLLKWPGLGRSSRLSSRERELVVREMVAENRWNQEGL